MVGSLPRALVCSLYTPAPSSAGPYPSIFEFFWTKLGWTPRLDVAYLGEPSRNPYVKAQTHNENCPPIGQLQIQSIHPAWATVPRLEPYLPRVSSRNGERSAAAQACGAGMVDDNMSAQSHRVGMSDGGSRAEPRRRGEGGPGERLMEGSLIARAIGVGYGYGHGSPKRWCRGNSYRPKIYQFIL